MKVLPIALAAIATAERAAAFAPTSPVTWNPRTQALQANVNDVESNTETSVEQDKEESENFKNDGPFAFMKEYLDMAGIAPGQRIAYGPFTTGQVPESERTSDTEASKRREEATRNLQNIDVEERNRRLDASKVATVVTIVYALWAALLGDQGDLAGHFLRFGVAFPLLLAYGYRKSYDEGL